MDDKLSILLSDIKEIKSDIKDLLKTSAVHNQILAQHEQRSTQLEERFTPVEQTYVFASKFAIAISILAGVAGIVRVSLELLRLR